MGTGNEKLREVSLGSAGNAQMPGKELGGKVLIFKIPQII